MNNEAIQFNSQEKKELMKFSKSEWDCRRLNDQQRKKLINLKPNAMDKQISNATVAASKPGFKLIQQTAMIH